MPVSNPFVFSVYTQYQEQGQGKSLLFVFSVYICGEGGEVVMVFMLIFKVEFS